MKVAKYFLPLLILCSCGDYTTVQTAYENGNLHAEELLMHGFNSRVSEHISTKLIKKALKGDEKAKMIIYAQMEMIRGMPPKNHTTVVPVPVHTHTIPCRGK